MLLCLTINATAATQFLGNSGGIWHYLEDVELTPEVRYQIQRNYQPKTVRVYPEITDIDLGTILNIAKEIWTIIEENQPVLNVKFDYANALPKGLRSSEELDGFSDLQMRAFRTYGVNTYGITVYDVTYTALHRYGGSYQGKGKYLENVTILPQNVEVAWAYTLNLGVAQVSAVNAGTKEAPVASLLMQMDLSVETVIKKSQMHHVFQFRGDSKDITTTRAK